MMREITGRQADAIVELVAALRLDWDKRGIVAALQKARTISQDPTRLATAAIFAANNAANLTPAIIAMQGDHWKALDPTYEPQPVRADRCGDCHGIHTPASPCEPQMAENWRDRIGELRQLHAAAKGKLCRHGLRREQCHRHDDEREPA